ncbi:MAG TPA: GH1 family beta-glucosidase [Acidimicrobiia bacterium]|nr:GH1 family beta-glucosidase [Acidimicrobiia bacterium]
MTGGAASAGSFPEDFAWGVATAAYQIEGGRHEQGKGDSIWDRFSDLGRLRDPGDVACDHYHRWEEDLDLLARLGVSSYRFSVSWPRVIPDGDGRVNQAGLDFYRRLVAGLRARGIAPFVTLYHWDLPQVLQDKGGWASRQTVEAFARYACVVAGALGDDTTHWITQNEPWVTTMLGHRDGVFAPGISDWQTAMTVGHHLLVAHGMAAEEVKGVLPDAQVGIGIDCRPARAASDSDEDHAAARHFDGARNRWFFDPIFGHGYPDDVMRTYRDRRQIDPDLVTTADLAIIATPIDFLGLNYYTTVTIGAGQEDGPDPGPESGKDPGPGYTDMGWRVDPAGLTRYLRHIHDTYAPRSILITENGASYSDGPDERGIIDDVRRIDYLRSHVEATAAARDRGVPVDGYFVWSLMDNLEWVEGFSQRFGLIWVDRETLDRTPKRSFDWYRGIVTAGTLAAS